MQESNSTKTGFNSTTLLWSTPNMSDFVPENVPEYAASRDDIEKYRQDGVVILRGVFSDWVEKLCSGLDRNLADPQAYRFPCESVPEGTEGRFFDSYCNWDLIPEYRDFALHSYAASMAGQFMESRTARLFHEHAFIKEPGTQCATPWHQDMPYYCINGEQTVSVYVALDHADEDVAVRFIKGSHSSGNLYYPRVFMDGANFNEDDRSMVPVPDIDSNSSDYDILGEEHFDVIRFIYRPSRDNERAAMSFHLTGREKNDIKNAIKLKDNKRSLKKLKKLVLN